MKKILPLGESPVMCYPNYGSVFSVLDAYTKEYLPWIYNHFIQLILPNNHNWGMRMDFAPPNVLYSLPWLSVSRIYRDIVDCQWNCVIDFIKKMIDSERYIFALFDISSISKYNINDPFQHEVLVYGYDDDNQQIYFMDNYDNGKFAKGLATYNEIINAAQGMKLNNLADWYPGYIVIEYRKIYDLGMYCFADDYKYKFNLQLFLGLVDDYLKGKATYYRWEMPPSFINYDTIESGNIWGIQIYDFIKEDIAINSGKEIDIRAFYVLKEHKSILYETCKYLNNLGLLPQEWDENYEKTIKKCIEGADRILFAVIKGNKTGRLNVNTKIYDQLDFLKKSDLIIFNALLQSGEKWLL